MTRLSCSCSCSCSCSIGHFEHEHEHEHGSAVLRATLLVLAVACLLGGPAVARAQTVRIDLQADKTEVEVNEYFTIWVTTEVNGGNVEQMHEPDLGAFRVLRRRVTQPMQFRIGFGGQTQTVQLQTVHHYTLMATTPGTYAIDPARVVVHGRTYRSNPLTLHVRGGSTAPPVGQPDPGATDPAEEEKPPEPGQVTVDSERMVDGGQFDPEAFIRTVADRVDPYVGEQVTATVYLYVRGGIRSAPVVSREPTTVGFWTHDLLPPQRTLDSTEQVVQGVPFQVYQLRRWALFPLRDGDLTIGAAELSVQTGSFFDMFRGPRELQRTGVPVTLHVRPLPPGPRPAVVGDFAVQASLDRTQVATGDAVTLTVQVQARRGNVRDARIELPAIDGLRALPPQTTDQIESPHDVVGGVRRIEWLIIPERAGTYRLPALGIDVFDPASGQYTRAESVPLTLTAAGNAVTPPPEPSAPEEDGAGEEEQSRFGPVHTSSELSREQAPISSQPWFPWAVAFGPAALVGLLLFSRIRRRLDQRRLATTPERVVRSARKRLSGARAMAESSDPTAFYGEIARVLQAVLEARLGGPVGGLTHRELHAHLGARGMEEDLARRVVEELEGCDYARFSAAGVARAEMESCADRVQAIVERLDRFTPRAEEPS